jgi:GNAT superfamily N-acetyltransferase
LWLWIAVNGRTIFALCASFLNPSVGCAGIRTGVGAIHCKTIGRWAAGAAIDLVAFLGDFGRMFAGMGSIRIARPSLFRAELVFRKTGAELETIKVTYLQMMAPPARKVEPPRDGLSVVHAQHPTVAYYRFLYDGVGKDYRWPRCRKSSDSQLSAIIHDPGTEIHVLMADGVPAGFAELDLRSAGEIELVQFGLLPEFIGQGLGTYFLNWVIDRAWTYAPKRLWLHTCNRDHPRALPNYKAAGFVPYKEEFKEVD